MARHYPWILHVSKIITNKYLSVTKPLNVIYIYSFKYVMKSYVILYRIYVYLKYAMKLTYCMSSR